MVGKKPLLDPPVPTKQEQNYLELQPEVGVKMSERELMWNVAVLVLQSSGGTGES